MKNKWLKLVFAISLLLVLNIGAYLGLTSDAGKNFLDGINELVYLGAFLLALIANSTVIVPIPYNAIILAMTQLAPLPWLIALSAAIGSAIGELTGYLVGKAGREVIKDTKFTRWLYEQMKSSWRAPLAIFLVAVPPNPAFGLVGIISGAVNLRIVIFATSVFLGRLLRFLSFALVVNFWLS